MKTAIYIEDGVVQLVLTPSNEFERNALRSFEGEGRPHAEIFHGEFYDCRGGWVRQQEVPLCGDFGRTLTESRSLIIRAQSSTKAAP